MKSLTLSTLLETLRTRPGFIKATTAQNQTLSKANKLVLQLSKLRSQPLRPKKITSLDRLIMLAQHSKPKLTNLKQELLLSELLQPTRLLHDFSLTYTSFLQQLMSAVLSLTLLVLKIHFLDYSFTILDKIVLKLIYC